VPPASAEPQPQRQKVKCAATRESQRDAGGRSTWTAGTPVAGGWHAVHDTVKPPSRSAAGRDALRPEEASLDYQARTTHADTSHRPADSSLYHGDSYYRATDFSRHGVDASTRAGDTSCRGGDASCRGGHSRTYTGATDATDFDESVRGGKTRSGQPAAHKDPRRTWSRKVGVSWVLRRPHVHRCPECKHLAARCLPDSRLAAAVRRCWER
jgi:hypothetical protein